jgi:2-polyprenyl-6-methoxyphenol hydroxylase-like FAD-dependent oxidoreductase
MSKPYQHAVVIGASMGGLLAARALLDNFERVTILERDDIDLGDTVPRKGVPQGRHPHALLTAGFRVLQRLFPSIVQDLQNAGAIFGDATANGYWFQNGGYLIQAPSDLNGVLLSRPQLETIVRNRVLALDNVNLETNVNVLGLIANDPQRVLGVKLDRGQGEEVLNADLVLDASGRGSRSLAWLEQLGFVKPEVSEVKVNVAYASREYERKSEHLNGGTHLIIAPNAPHQKRGGVMLATEHDRWMVALLGMHGDHPPVDEIGFLEFARSLPTTDLYNIIKNAKPLGDITPHKYPASTRRHYEKLKSFPEGYLVFGDALCNFNPIFGQGMTVASLEAEALNESLKFGLLGLWKNFFKRASSIIDIAWTLAAGADFAFAETVGKRGPETGIINAYIAKLLTAAWHDPALTVAFHNVSNLVKPPTSLFHPSIVWRVFRASRIPAKPSLSFGALVEAGD